MIQTLVEALSALPRGAARGFRFVSAKDEERYYPFEAIEQEARRRAAGLAAQDLKKGDRLALVVGDPEDFVFSFLGAVLAGVVPVPIHSRANFSFRARQSYLDTVRHIVAVSGARALLTDSASQPVLQEVAGQCRTLERIVLTHELPEGDRASFRSPSISPSDVCFMQFTSGSTSQPRGVVVTHGNLVANARCIFGVRGLDRREDDVHLAWLPLYHDMGLVGFVLSPLICDVPTVLLPTSAFARRPTVWMKAMHKYRGTITYGPNFAYALAARRTRDEDLAGLDLRHVRITGCGAEPINPDALRAFCDRFAPAGFRAEAMLPSYGMAEATLAITFHRRDTPMVTDVVSASALARGEAVPVDPLQGGTVELVSCGPAFPGHEVRIVDEDGRPLPERQVGQILTRGPSVTSRYFGNPEATAETYREGWLHTGDLGYLAEGNLYICGRLKDLIILRGTNYYAHDIEWALAELPGLRLNGVVAFSVQRDGEEALVICAEARASDLESLRTLIAEKVAEVWGLRPADVVLVRSGSLSQTSSGKVQRRKTKHQYEAGELEVLGATLPADEP